MICPRFDKKSNEFTYTATAQTQKTAGKTLPDRLRQSRQDKETKTSKPHAALTADTRCLGNAHTNVTKNGRGGWGLTTATVSSSPCPHLLCHRGCWLRPIVTLSPERGDVQARGSDQPKKALVGVHVSRQTNQERHAAIGQRLSVPSLCQRKAVSPREYTRNKTKAETKLCISVRGRSDKVHDVGQALVHRAEAPGPVDLLGILAAGAVDDRRRFRG